MIDFVKQPGWKVLELGGGANRHPASDVNVDVRSAPGVDFTVDFNKPEWPEIGSEEFDVVLCIFVLEHISWRNTSNFLKQVYRVLKPGGKTIFVIPNTLEQMRHIVNKPEFDGDEGSMLFGDLDYPENSHRAAFSPKSAVSLFSGAGFINVVVTPYGEPLKTDMIVEATKSSQLQSPYNYNPTVTPAPTQKWSSPPPPSDRSNIKSASEIYDWKYFDNYGGRGFIWDYPENVIIAQKILDRKPQSVLELGCARGYVLKRIQDAGIPVQGVDVSRHAALTRVCDPISVWDLTKTPWDFDCSTTNVDLVVSISLLEHIPEWALSSFIEEMRGTERGLHGVTVEGRALTHDPTRCTLRPLGFWKSVLPGNHEVVDIRELVTGTIPDEITKSGGKIRLNIGCAFTMFHGWTNMDVIDGENFAKAFRYEYVRHDVRNGLSSYSTSVVSEIFLHHFLEHLTYDEGVRFLRECRRIIRSDGCMRIVVPNAYEACQLYRGYGGAETNILSDLNEMNVGCAKSITDAGKLWSILLEGHKSIHDKESLEWMLDESGWECHHTSFRKTEVARVKEILRTTTEMSYGGTSLFCDALPKITR